MPVIPSDTVRIDERPDADTPEVQARIALATDGVDHAVDPTRRVGDDAVETAMADSAPARRRRTAPAEPDAA